MRLLLQASRDYDNHLPAGRQPAYQPSLVVSKILCTKFVNIAISNLRRLDYINIYQLQIIHSHENFRVPTRLAFCYSACRLSPSVTLLIPIRVKNSSMLIKNAFTQKWNIYKIFSLVLNSSLFIFLIQIKFHYPPGHLN